MEGWIAINRAIQKHWIFENPKYFKWWVQILLNVNHAESKVLIGNQLHVCGPGQSFRSIESWSRLFGCSKRSVINFFNLLERDQMCNRRTIGKGNRRKHLLTVTNWSTYQPGGKPKSSNPREHQEKQDVQKKSATPKNSIRNPKGITNNKDIKKYYQDLAGESNNNKFKLFVEYLLESDLEKVFQLPEQINERWFERIYSTANGNRDLIKTKIDAMEAKRDLLKKYDSFPRTLNNWLKK